MLAIAGVPAGRLGLVSNTSGDQEYERSAATEIQAWKDAGPSRFARATGLLFRPLNAPIDKILSDPRAQQVVQKAMEKALEAGTWSVPSEGILRGYVNDGYKVSTLEDIPRLVPLGEADERLSGSRLRHIGAAAGVGTAGGLAVVVAAGTGAAASPGSGGASIPAGLATAFAAAGADVVATTGLCCRLVSLAAANYGFDTSDLPERNYALQVLNAALADTNEEKFTALTTIAALRNQLIRVKQPWSELEKNLLATSIRKGAARFGQQITQAQLRRLVSVVGVATAGGFNGFQMRDVGRAAYFMYRERFLLARHGPGDDGQLLLPAAS